MTLDKKTVLGEIDRRIENLINRKKSMIDKRRNSDISEIEKLDERRHELESLRNEFGRTRYKKTADHRV